MNLQTFAAPKPLEDWVACFWTLTTEATEARGRSSQRVLPDGFPELIVHLAAPYERHQNGRRHRDPTAFVFGQLDEPIELISRQPVVAVGARLQPAALAEVASCSGRELYGRPVALDELWGKRGLALERRLRTMGGATTALQLLAQELTALRRRHATSRKSMDRGQQLADYAATWIQRTQGRGSIQQLGRHLGYSRRHVERLFRDHLGVTPKRFARLQRFQALQRAALATSRHDWQSLAIDAGYSDQPHMIRELRKFSGQTPTAFARSRQPLARALVMRPG